MLRKLLALTLCLSLGIVAAIVGTSRAEGTDLISVSTVKDGSTTVIGSSTIVTPPVITVELPKTYRICGKDLTLDEWAKSWLVQCARDFKQRVNDKRHYAHRRGIQPRVAFWNRTKIALIKWVIPRWRDVKLPKARALKREHRRWHREHQPYGYVTHYGVPYSVIQNFTCIHLGEGAWNDPNPTYYGGLQMDYSFMQTYGYYKGMNFLKLWGTADHWPVWAQFRAGYNALLAGRGYYPWPLTARHCGLI